MTQLDDDLRADGGRRIGLECPAEGCEWRFLQPYALEAHRAVQHDEAGRAFREDPEPPEEVVAGD